MASDAGVVTGEYYQDHQTVAYQSQGVAQGIDLQYSSGQANPLPVVQYQFTTPVAGESSSITSITAQVSLGGVIQGDPTTYTLPTGGLTDGMTYNIPLQVDASALATGVYPYDMEVSEIFGTEDPVTVTTSNQGYVNVVNNSASARAPAGRSEDSSRSPRWTRPGPSWSRPVSRERRCSLRPMPTASPTFKTLP